MEKNEYYLDQFEVQALDSAYENNVITYFSFIFSRYDFTLTNVI